MTTSNVAEIDESSLLKEFKLNDRVWVNGTKPGTIGFIGETQFKEGIWAGIILDTCEGKNNGSLNGVTYFVTEENRGVFCRLSKLTKTPPSQEQTNARESSLSSVQTKPESNAGGLRVGARVMIHSSVGGPIKIGTLRYLGTADFAKGDWAGVELDETVGKNDGSVAGKRYFQCKPLHGVFAPAQKVELYDATRANANQTTPQNNRPLQSKLSATADRRQSSKLCKQLSGSQESLVSEKSSIYSTASSALKNTNKSAILANQKNLAKAANLKNSQTPSIASSTLTSTAKKPVVSQPVLQQSLKEKEGHIMQLLKERDFERAEFTRAAQKFEQTETKLIDQTKLIQQKDEEITSLKQTIDSLKEAKSDLIQQHDTDRTRIEDLEFQIEEHKLGIVKSDDENSSAAPNHDISLSKHDSSVSSNHEEENLVLKQLKLQQDISKNHLEEIKFLKEQIDTLNIDLKQLRLGEEVYSQEKRDFKKIIEERENELSLAKKGADECFSLKESIKELEAKLKFVNDESETSKNKWTAMINGLNARLQSSETQRSEIEFLYEESSVKLGDLNSKLEEKEKEIGQLKNEIGSCKQSLSMLNTSQANDDLEFSLEEQKVQVQELESKLSSMQLAHKDELKKLNDTIIDLVNSKDQLENDVKQLNETLERLNGLDKEYAEFKQQKEKEIHELSFKLNNLNEASASSSNEKEQSLKAFQKEFEEYKLKKESEFDELNRSHASEQKKLQDNTKRLEVLLEESQTSSAELKARMNELIQNSGDFSLQLTTLNESMKEKEQLVESLRSNLSSLEAQLNDLKDKHLKELSEKDQQIKSVENSVAEMQRVKELEINKLNEDASATQKQLQEKCKSCELLLSESKNLNAELEARITELIHNSGDNSLQLTSLNENLKEKEKLVESLQANILNLETKLSDLNEASSKKLAEKENIFNGLQKEYLAFKQEKETEIVKLNEESNKSYNELQDKYDRNVALLEEGQTRINELIQNSGNYSLQLTTLNESLKEKEKLVESLQSHAFNLEAEMSSLNDLNKKSSELQKEIKIETEQLSEENRQLNGQLAKLKESNDATNKNLNDKETKLASKQEEIVILSQKVADYQARIDSIQSINENFAKEQQILNENKLKSEDDHAKQIAQLNKDKLELANQTEQFKNELIQLTEANDKKQSQLSQQISNLTNDKQDLVSKVQSLTAEKLKLESESKQAFTSSQDLQNEQIEQLEKDLNESNLKIISMEDKNRQLQQDYELTINDLKSIMQQNEESTEEKTNELTEYKTQFNEMEAELNNKNDLIAEIELENEQLRNEIDQLKKMKELNSNNATLGNSSKAPSHKSSSNKPAPRLFCDICDQFDLHDTEDCPQQSMPDQNEKITHSNYNAIQSTNRAYCDLCEEFGHEEDNCPNINKSNNNANKENLSDEEF